MRQTALAPRHLTWTIFHDAITITTIEQGNSLVVVYPIGDLLSRRQAEEGWIHDFDSLIGSIMEDCSAESWVDAGADGTIEVFENTASLVISQREQVHREVELHLARLRESNWRVPLVEIPPP